MQSLPQCDLSGNPHELPPPLFGHRAEVSEVRAAYLAACEEHAPLPPEYEPMWHAVIDLADAAQTGEADPVRALALIRAETERLPAVRKRYLAARAWTVACQEKVPLTAADLVAIFAADDQLRAALRGEAPVAEAVEVSEQATGRIYCAAYECMRARARSAARSAARASAVRRGAVAVRRTGHRQTHHHRHAAAGAGGGGDGDPEPDPAHHPSPAPRAGQVDGTTPFERDITITPDATTPDDRAKAGVRPADDERMRDAIRRGWPSRPPGRKRRPTAEFLAGEFRATPSTADASEVLADIGRGVLVSHREARREAVALVALAAARGYSLGEAAVVLALAGEGAS